MRIQARSVLRRIGHIFIDVRMSTQPSSLDISLRVSKKEKEQKKKVIWEDRNNRGNMQPWGSVTFSLLRRTKIKNENTCQQSTRKMPYEDCGRHRHTHFQLWPSLVKDKLRWWWWWWWRSFRYFLFIFIFFLSVHVCLSFLLKGRRRRKPPDLIFIAASSAFVAGGVVFFFLGEPCGRRHTVGREAI